MSERSEYPAGTPSWMDLATPDLDAAAQFYGGLFGWESVESGPVEETGGYRFFTLRGRKVAGVGPTFEEGQPPVWSTYISVEDADATLAAARERGATVMMDAMQVLDAGRLAVMSDPVGAVIALWEPAGHRGAELVNEPGTMCWNELACRDPEQAKRFYGEVFGWTAETQPTGGTTYTAWQLGGAVIGGMLEMNEGWPETVPPHWMNYVAVEDTDAVAARAEELGGRISVPPTDIPGIGRFAVLSDPAGAMFSVLAMSGAPA